MSNVTTMTGQGLQLPEALVNVTEDFADTVEMAVRQAYAAGVPLGLIIGTLEIAKFNAQINASQGTL